MKVIIWVDPYGGSLRAVAVVRWRSGLQTTFRCIPPPTVLECISSRHL